MKSYRIYPSSINERYISECAEALSDGSIMLYPTDTLYAIACDATNQGAIERLCRIKGLNPQKNTLSIICADISQASEYVRIDNRAFDVLRRFTPGPFTFILPTATTLPKAFKGRRKVGLRIPDNPIPRELAAELGHPLLTTSIPTDGLDENELTMPDEIMLRFDSNPEIDIMIDGGDGTVIPSTVVDITDPLQPEILREGAGKFE